ncbi:preprotein translocase subunit YajC [Aedoeadaptatus ivorii]|uniref:Preprotein translocase subunit YajC n=1 Tax=Aedoeadaptatus ivorii TaxID=54006 RepID=A0A448V1I7_9FIRM|nr:preprotein translocase subunit YajC [Peptoniphilus ivorii]MDQ0507866.1 preprotein translocase subunit YajC [Peptoniphilus ivorii]VEJ35693.1 preprotein translocase subunit YajC [Peptoniphilus ivorii]
MEFGSGTFPLGAAQGQASMIPTLVTIVMMMAIFYFGIIRPNKKKEKEAAKMLENLAVGDKIQTYGGIVAKIVQIKEDVVLVESSGMKTRLELMKWSIKSVLKPAHKKSSEEETE